MLQNAVLSSLRQISKLEGWTSALTLRAEKDVCVSRENIIDSTIQAYRDDITLHQHRLAMKFQNEEMAADFEGMTSIEDVFLLLQGSCEEQHGWKQGSISRSQLQDHKHKLLETTAFPHLADCVLRAQHQKEHRRPLEC